MLFTWNDELLFNDLNDIVFDDFEDLLDVIEDVYESKVISFKLNEPKSIDRRDELYYPVRVIFKNQTSKVDQNKEPVIVGFVKQEKTKQFSKGLF